MFNMRPIFVVIIAISCFTTPCAGEDAPPFYVPDGFVVSKFAGDDLAHDIWAMTVDNEGHLVVCGPGYVKTLMDIDGDGAADEARLFTDKVRGAQGLFFDGHDLIAAEQPGLFVYRDSDGDGVADGEREQWLKFGGGGEHGAHGIRKGPDGWFYIMVGNNTGINKNHVKLPTSPIKNPSQGCVLRVAPDGSASEVIAHGFRNAYDLAINKHGDIFTYDSDGERDHQLPWYSHTRVFHVRVGGHHGWLLGGWRRSFNRPDYFFDSVDRLISIDRGSPTGVEIYRHTAFPKKYRDGLFFACWTYGRIYFSPLVREGNTYKQFKPEIFMETTGHVGFAPVDMVVHPDSGDLFVAIGGRGTQGAVYRVSYSSDRENAKNLPDYETPADWSIHNQQIELPQAREPLDGLNLFQIGVTNESRQDMLDGIRHLMLNLGDIYTGQDRRPIDEGYTAKKPDALNNAIRDPIIEALTESFPTGDHDVDYEIGRLLGMLHAEHPNAIRKIASKFTNESHPTDDAHFLFCLLQMPGARDEQTRRAIAGAFLLIDQKIEARNLMTDRNWSRNIRDAFQIHLQLDKQLEETVRKHPAYSHPAQTYLLNTLPAEHHEAAARAMLERRRDAQWNPQALSFVMQLPAEDLLPLFREQWQHPNLRAVVAGFLLKHGNDNDRKIVKDAFRPTAVRIDPEPFNERLDNVDWAAGNAKRGQALFGQYQCVTCHSGNKRLGPDLKGITKRFSRNDLMHNINDPNLSISELYRAIEVTTRDGETFIGVPVYQSISQTILEIGTGQTVRFSAQDIVDQKPATQSSMPAELLDPASDQDLADLYAYLSTL